MSVLQNDIFLKALRKEPIPYTPVWMMRQAGRYLPEYKATRAEAGTFLDLCHNTDLATEVTLQPLEHFDLDAAILFSDILTVPDAMGLGLYFTEGEGPKFHHPLQDEASILKLAVPDMQDLNYVFDAVTSIKSALNGRVPLIGFSGSPFTLACYMIEGGSSKDFRQIKTLMYTREDLLHRVLEVNAKALTHYLNAQIACGADAVQIFDTWGGVLSDVAYRQFSLNYMKYIAENLNKSPSGEDVPLIIFTKGGGLFLEDMADIGADAIGLDWTCDLGLARQRVGDKVALQGNMDPMVLFGSPEKIEQEVARILACYGEGSGHVFNLGHGINQYVNPEHARIFINAVHRLSETYHL